MKSAAGGGHLIEQPRLNAGWARPIRRRAVHHITLQYALVARELVQTLRLGHSAGRAPGAADCLTYPAILN
jgi:hypothetical protein